MTSIRTIIFSRNHDNRAKFIQITPDFSPERVKEIFIGQKQSKQSAIVLSLVGSAKEGHIRSKLFQLFRDNLLQIAKTTDLWLISAGLNSRVAKFFGEIIQTNPDPSRPISLIGIAACGCICGNEQFNDGCQLDIEYSKTKSEHKDEILLESNHTHFILVNDGTKHNHQCALKYRAKFENSIRGQSNSSFYSTDIPVVVVIIEGCSDAVKKAHRSVMFDRFPVVFIEGTGGCCDLFAKCYHLYNKYKLKGLINETMKNQIRELLEITDSELDETSCTNAPVEGTDYFELIYECVEKRNEYLNFLDYQIHHDLRYFLLQACFRILSNRDSAQKLEQLNIAYEWKQVEIMKTFIMKNDTDWKKINLNNLFERSLRENQVDFIELCLDHDFSLEDVFVDHQKYIDLYQNEFNSMSNKLTNLESIHRNILESYVGDFFQIDNHRTSSINVNQELFYWSILTDRFESGLLFWARQRNKICAAFIAILIFQSKLKKSNNSKYTLWINQFEQLAVDILDKFYETDDFTCKLAIIRIIPEFHCVTWLQLAVMAESRAFIAQTAVQDVLNDIWYGYISSDTGQFRIVFSSFILCSSPFLSYQSGFIGENPRLDRLLSNDHKLKTKMTLRTYFNNLLLFISAPCVKYLYNLYSHMIFLMLFSYVILCDYYPFYEFQSDQCSVVNNKTQNTIKIFGTPSIIEFVLIIWVFTLLCEEIRQILSKQSRGITRKIYLHFSIFWNRIDALAISLFILACILRFYRCQACFCFARNLLAIDLSIWFIRTLDLFSAFKRLGPKLVMIGEMFHDLKYFMLILTVFVLAFGIPAYSLIHNNQTFSWHILRDIINLSYWQIFGELYAIDKIEENYQLSGYVVFFLLIAFITIASVLLINLLIAMFSNIFDRLTVDTDCIWKFQQYALVRYHLKRPFLPAPFIFLSHIHRLFKKMFRRKKHQHISRTKFSINVNQNMTKQIEDIEEALGQDIYRSSKSNQQSNMEHYLKYLTKEVQQTTEAEQTCCDTNTEATCMI